MPLILKESLEEGKCEILPSELFFGYCSYATFQMIYSSKKAWAPMKEVAERQALKEHVEF
jgi:hypothetical protein